MAAEDHLNEQQFMNPHEMAAKYWDRNLKNPETLRKWSGQGYISNLTDDIKKNGIKNPVQLTGQHSDPHIYDGHHRVVAAMDAGMDVPYKWVSGKPGEQ